MLRFYDRLIGGLAGLAGIALFVIAAMIVVDVTLRTIGTQPPQAISALSEYGLLYATMAAAPWLARSGGHVTVHSLTSRLPSGAQSILRKMILVLAILLCLTLAVAAAGMAIESFGRGDVDIRSIDLPRWLLFAPLAIGFALLAAEFSRLLILGEAMSDEASDGF